MKRIIDISDRAYNEALTVKEISDIKDLTCQTRAEVFLAIQNSTSLEQEPTTKNLAADIEDAVERLNAIKQLIGYDKDSEIVKATQKSLDMAIKALRQEPMLDKIRTEILENAFSVVNPNNTYEYINVLDLGNIEKIIDRYKAESEET